jgi:hypothetical protein
MKPGRFTRTCWEFPRSPSRHISPYAAGVGSSGAVESSSGRGAGFRAGSEGPSRLRRGGSAGTGGGPAMRAGYHVSRDQPLEGYDRLYVDDPFGNRIELMEPKR